MEITASTLPIAPITVLVVDDYTLVRTAISQILTSQPNIKQVAVAQNYAEAEKLITQLSPAIIWLDLHIAGSDSVAEINYLKKLSPDTHIMALTDVEDEQEAFVAIIAGAQGYRCKQDMDPEEIMPIIQMLCRSEFVLRPVLLAQLMQRLRTAALSPWGSEKKLRARGLLHNPELNGLARLTTQDREALQRISQVFRYDDIAKELHISEKTVQKYVQSLLSKLGV
jgi:two-component system nitrate/nitrite response regulator NarL